jgi:hypothetical protein
MVAGYMTGIRHRSGVRSCVGDPFFGNGTSTSVPENHSHKAHRRQPLVPKPPRHLLPGIEPGKAAQLYARSLLSAVRIERFPYNIVKPLRCSIVSDAVFH